MKTKRLLAHGMQPELLRRAVAGDPVARRLAGSVTPWKWRKVVEYEHSLSWSKKAWRRTAARNERGGEAHASRREFELKRLAVKRKRGK